MLSNVSDVKLISAKEAAKILGVNPNKIYELWKDNKLVWWSINGTKKTTKEALCHFLSDTQCTTLR